MAKRGLARDWEFGCKFIVALRVVLCEGEDLLGLWQLMGDRGVEGRVCPTMHDGE